MQTPNKWQIEDQENTKKKVMEYINTHTDK